MANFKKLILFIFGCLYSLNVFAAGWIDRAIENRYQGWACRAGSSEQVGIHIWRDDGKYLGGGAARNAREPSVQVACKSNHSNHGFDIAISISPEIQDGREHYVRIYGIYANGEVGELSNSPTLVKFSKSTLVATPPEPSAVVGRDLNVTGFGYLGHIGIWDGSRVVEMLNEGDANKAKFSTWDDFRVRSVLWGNVNPNISTHRVTNCFSTKCVDQNDLQRVLGRGGVREVSARESIYLRAQQIQQLSASYTLTTQVISALPEVQYYSTAHCNPFATGICNGIWKIVQKKPGVYRCDTFTIEAYASSSLSSHALKPWFSVGYRPFTGDDFREPIWKQKMTALVANTTYLPSAIFNRLGGF